MASHARKFAALSFAIIVLHGASSAQGSAMTASEIRRIIIGHTIYLAAPVMGEFPLNYRRNGVVDGNGTAFGLGEFMRPKDSGHWSINGNQLCQQFKTWYKGEKFCFGLTLVTPSSVKWLRNDGDSGVARIGN